eukprot:c16604_g1_i1 orf=256-828(+)
MGALNVWIKAGGVAKALPLLHPPLLRIGAASRPLHELTSCHPSLSIHIEDNNHFHYVRDIKTRAHSSERSSQGSPIRAVPVQVAHELLNAGHRYLDVRTAEEFAAGHVEGAVNIPYMYKVGTGLTKNLRFLEDVGDKFGKDDEVVVGCQMGKRSQMAAGELVAAGFTGITDMAGGYMAWVQSGMPTKATI